jgi:hypothetical protein
VITFRRCARGRGRASVSGCGPPDPDPRIARTESSSAGASLASDTASALMARPWNLIDGWLLPQHLPCRRSMASHRSHTGRDTGWTCLPPQGPARPRGDIFAMGHSPGVFPPTGASLYLSPASSVPRCTLQDARRGRRSRHHRPLTGGGDGTAAGAARRGRRAVAVAHLPELTTDVPPLHASRGRPGEAAKANRGWREVGVADKNSRCGPAAVLGSGCTGLVPAA